MPCSTHTLPLVQYTVYRHKDDKRTKESIFRILSPFAHVVESLLEDFDFFFIHPSVLLFS